LINFLFINKTSIRKIVFFLIYKSNHWNKSILIDSNILLVSGPGSLPGSVQTKNIITNLNNFIKDNNIRNILDMPCGDFAWMQDLLKINNDINYTGYDIVEEIILINKKKYSSNRIDFFVKDIINENDFNGFDLIFIRDFFIHINNEDILKVLKKIKNAKIKFFACLTNKNEIINKNIAVGEHRKINLSIEPFNLKDVFFSFYEGKEDRYINFYKVI